MYQALCLFLGLPQSVRWTRSLASTKFRKQALKEISKGVSAGISAGVRMPLAVATLKRILI